MTNSRARARWAWLAAAGGLGAALLLVFDTGGLRALLFPTARTEPTRFEASLLDAAAFDEPIGPSLQGARRHGVTGGATKDAAQEGPAVEIKIANGLPLDVSVHETLAGRVVDARWQAAPRLGRTGDTWDRTSLAVEPGKCWAISVSVTPPRGMTCDPDAEWSVSIHPRARRLSAVVPVRPEAQVFAVLPPELGALRRADWSAAFSTGREAWTKAQAVIEPDGRIAIRGVPYLLGEKVELRLVAAESEQALLSEEVSEASPALLGTGALGHDPLAAVEVRLREGLLSDDDMPYEEALGEVETDYDQPFQAHGRNRLRLHVRLAGGGPAVGAIVRWGLQGNATGEGMTDATGRLDVSGLPPGTYTVLVSGAGAATSVQAEVKQGQTTDMDVRTGEGGVVEVEVVDGEGHALPYATVGIAQPSGLDWMDFDGEVQRIDKYTDVHGKRTLRVVEPGLVKVYTWYGSRFAQSDVPVVEGETTRARLVVPPPVVHTVLGCSPPPSGGEERLNVLLEEIVK